MPPAPSLPSSQADDERYTPILRAIGVMRIVPTELFGRTKLGQHRCPAQMNRALDGLWNRGAEGDLAAIDLISEAHADKLWPSYLKTLEGVECRALRPILAPACGPGADARIEEAVKLLRDEYWNLEVSDEQLRRAHRSSHWLALVDSVDGSLVASARAITDDAKYARILDVVVRKDHRAKGVGDGLLRLLLEHPSIRECRSVFLSTRDAMTFYSKYGFENHQARHTAMRLERHDAHAFDCA